MRPAAGGAPSPPSLHPSTKTTPALNFGLSNRPGCPHTAHQGRFAGCKVVVMGCSLSRLQREAEAGVER